MPIAHLCMHIVYHQCKASFSADSRILYGIKDGLSGTLYRPTSSLPIIPAQNMTQRGGEQTHCQLSQLKIGHHDHLVVVSLLMVCSSPLQVNLCTSHLVHRGLLCTHLWKERSGSLFWHLAHSSRSFLCLVVKGGWILDFTGLATVPRIQKRVVLAIPLTPACSNTSWLRATVSQLLI